MVFVAFILLGQLLLIIGQQLRDVHWEYDNSRQNKVPQTSIVTKSGVRSRIECASVCTKDDSSAVPGVFFNKDVKQCLCSLTLHRPISSLVDKPGFVYLEQRACEIDGYTKLQPGLCVKAYETNHTYGNSQHYCSFEGGRLVRIDSSTKHDVLKSHLMAVTSKSNMVYYIDGTKNNGDWVFSDNTIIPSSALVWAKGEPHADKCLSLFNSNFMHGDTICSGHADGFNFGFVCERVI